MRSWLVLALASVAILHSAARADAGEDFMRQLVTCKVDSDCGIATEVWPACNHICGSYKYDKCDSSTRLCPAFNKKAEITADCAVNAPCRAPKRIWCESGKCKSE